MSEVKYTLDRSSSIATFVIDTAGPVNTIGLEFIADLETACERANADEAKGVIIRSGKRASFLDGANLKEIMGGGGRGGVRHLLLRYQEALAALAQSPFPVVALLDGQTALGGGMELILWACDHVFTTAKSRMGLPEVSVGLFPAGGGMQTLPKVVGFKTATDLILNGRVGPAGDYAKTSLVTVCDSADLTSRAVSWIEEHQGIRNRNYDPNFEEPDRMSVEKQREVLAAAKTRYGQCAGRPYLLAALESLENGLKFPFDAAVRDDVELFVRLLEHPNARNKVDLFFLVTSLGPKLVKVDPRKAVPASSLAIIGSGLMGRGIAQVSADKGIRTLLIDVDEKTAKDAVESIKATLDGLVNKGRWSSDRRDRAAVHLVPSADYNELAHVPLIIECVFEDLSLKKKILAQVREVNPTAIFASNTSTLPMAEISEGSMRPELVVGMHFFSPVPLMPLLEVIEGPQTGAEAVATAVTVGRALGKTVILVGDGPGFYTSRTFGSYVTTGFRLAELGVSPWDVDRLAVRAGFPQGPLHVYGTAGGNVVYHAGGFMAERLPDRLPLSQTLVNMYKAGFVGAGKPSFYLDDRTMTRNEAALDQIVPVRGIPTPTEEETADILLLSMVNEAFWCLSDEVLRDYHSMDLGAVLGIGFPDCWHGPARYAGLKGVTAVKNRLNELAEKFRLSNLVPAPEFDRLAACGLDSNLI
ncbi:MAG: 3-hydroxyacyl-CoA dehydrogenase NAD-binding domain-containing protein [Desulfomonilaceae bacterium]|nr:3-hydroxyacyl-CoA dehydrogenase NAD-binding domain-containing protein [Desulfomonilaceae bacterium]